MNKVPLFTFLFSFALIIGCAQNKQDKKDFLITIQTPYGEMKAILYDETPKHKANFIKLAKEGYYDSLLFHRIIQGFMIQGGDPQSKNASAGQALGSGGPGYTVDAEINPKYFHEKGAFSAARLGDQMNPTKASSGSQFYIVHGTVVKENDLKTDQNKLNQGLSMLLQKEAYMYLRDTLSKYYYSGDRERYMAELMKLKPLIKEVTGVEVDKDVSPEKIKAYTTSGGAPHLDGEYTVFGKVISGLEVIDKIAALAKDARDRPQEDIRMFVSVEETTKKKITKAFGYEYPIL
jgi:peptidyl-prolyl cis-trans isomerase B (cyclophilin B)